MQLGSHVCMQEHLANLNKMLSLHVMQCDCMTCKHNPEQKKTKKNINNIQKSKFTNSIRWALQQFISIFITTGPITFYMRPTGMKSAFGVY